MSVTVRMNFNVAVPPPKVLPVVFRTVLNQGAPWVGEEKGPVSSIAQYGVAVEQNTGRVYVLDYERKTGMIQVFSAEGAPLRALANAAYSANLSRKDRPSSMAPGPRGLRWAMVALCT